PSGPIVASVNGATAPAGPIGSTVVIQGSNLGATQGTGQVLFANGSGGTVAAVIASASDWTNTLIVTSVPSGAATGNLVVNTVGRRSAGRRPRRYPLASAAMPSERRPIRGRPRRASCTSPGAPTARTLPAAMCSLPA